MVPFCKVIILSSLYTKQYYNEQSIIFFTTSKPKASKFQASFIHLFNIFYVCARLVSEIIETPAADLHFRTSASLFQTCFFYFSKHLNLPLKRLVIPLPMLYLVHKEQGTNLKEKLKGKRKNDVL